LHDSNLSGPDCNTRPISIKPLLNAKSKSFGFGCNAEPISLGFGCLTQVSGPWRHTQEPWVRTLAQELWVRTPELRALGPDAGPKKYGSGCWTLSLGPDGSVRPKRLGFTPLPHLSNLGQTPLSYPKFLWWSRRGCQTQVNNNNNNNNNNNDNNNNNNNNNN
jgi:hypothetical protein